MQSWWYDSVHFLSFLSLAKVWNSFVLRLSRWLSVLFKKQIHWGQAEFLSLEPTNLCNLKCPGCPSGTDNLNRPRQFMPWDVYRQLIDQSYRTLVNLQLFFQGEPLMHPKIAQMVAYAHKRKIYTTISTNGQFLTAANSEALVQAGLSRLIVSIDGATQKVYEKYRVGGSLEMAIKGIQNVQQACVKLGRHQPLILLQFVLMGPNEQELPAIRQLAQKLQVRLQIKSAQIDLLPEKAYLLPKETKYARYDLDKDGALVLKRKKRFYCKRIWQGAVVSASGDLLPCCFDKQAKYSYGNTRSQSITKLFKNKEAAALRLRVWEGDSSLAMCANCSEGLKKRILF